MSKTVADVLGEMIALFENPDRWCKHHDLLFEGREAIPVPKIMAYLVAEEKAQFCLRGAAQAFCPNKEDVTTLHEVGRVISNVLTHDRGVCSITYFNDAKSTTHEDVMLVLKKALYSVQEVEGE